MVSVVEAARELEARDESLAAAVEELRALERESERLRGRAAEIVALEARAPAERVELEQRAADAARELQERRAAEREAEAAVASAEESADRARIADAERALVRARDAASTSARKLAHIEGLATDLEAALGEAARERPELVRAAADTAARIAAVPRLEAPRAEAADLAAVVDWAARARSALLLARSAAERERESVVREATELGASLLGEPAYGASVAEIRRRLEAR